MSTVDNPPQMPVTFTAGNGLEVPVARPSVWIGRATALLAALLLAMSSATSAPAAEAQRPLRGVALVVGNGDYEHLPKLANPPGDARAIEGLLSGLGFDTALSSDRNAKRLARDLEGLVDDAEGADVAVLYYAGHGIEAGGENFLVPTDADVASLDEAATRLVPISGIVAELRRKAEITIVLLDACRDDPFPPGAQLKLAPGASPQPVAAAGLSAGDSRGARALAPSAVPADDSLGIVMGFSAEPGKVALDGKAGANSPYAAAILEHLPAMAGTEFSQVMRMVGEEVYLRTAGAQRPWVNESLRRLLYFGEAPAQPEGDEGDILSERRQLLVTIAALPDFRRRQVERAAADGGVPMDALYGMLRAIGADVPADPARLDQLLRSQTERLREILAERSALKAADPEIVRLAGLAEQALREGALQNSVRLYEEAKLRISAQAPVLEQAEADLKARRTEFAAVFAASARAHALVFDFAAAARDYEQAYLQVEKWDDRLAWDYANGETQALVSLGSWKGDRAALERALKTGALAAEIAARTGDRSAGARTRHNMGAALSGLGDMEAGTDRLRQAAAAYSAAIAAQDDEQLRTASRVGLATVLSAIGERTDDVAALRDAAASLEETLPVLERHGQTAGLWLAQYNRGLVLKALAERNLDSRPAADSIAALETALSHSPRDGAPLEWGMTKYSLAVSRAFLGYLSGHDALIRESISETQQALGELTRERTPVAWARANHSIALSNLMLGERENSEADFEAALTAVDAALEEYRRDRYPLPWADAMHDRGKALYSLAAARGDVEMARQAIDAWRSVLEVRTPERTPAEWAATEVRLSDALFQIGELQGDVAMLDESAAGYSALSLRLTEQDRAGERARYLNSGAYALAVASQIAGQPERLPKAAGMAEEAVAIQSRLGDAEALPYSRDTLCTVLSELGRDRHDRQAAERAVASCETARAEFSAQGKQDQIAEVDAHLAAARSLLSQLAAD